MTSITKQLVVLHREVHKTVKQLNDVCHVHITVDRIKFVLVPTKVPSSSWLSSYTHRAMLASVSSTTNCARVIVAIMAKKAGAVKACRRGMRYTTNSGLTGI